MLIAGHMPGFFSRDRPISRAIWRRYDRWHGLAGAAPLLLTFRMVFTGFLNDADAAGRLAAADSAADLHSLACQYHALVLQ